jgi:hypothetical protein
MRNTSLSVRTESNYKPIKDSDFRLSGLSEFQIASVFINIKKVFGFVFCSEGKWPNIIGKMMGSWYMLTQNYVVNRRSENNSCN